MKKQEALSHIRSEVGFVPAVMVFEIYSDDDEIPQGLIDRLIRSAKPKKMVLYGSAKYFEALEKSLKNDRK